jgi:hypothetical protein
MIRQRGGRFLTPNMQDNGFWDIGDRQAYAKTRQLLLQECKVFHSRGNPALEVDQVALAKMVHLSGSPRSKGGFHSYDTLQSAVKLLVIPPKPGPEWIHNENYHKRKQLYGQDNTTQHLHAASYYSDGVSWPDTISSASMAGPGLYAPPIDVFDSSHHISDNNRHPIPTECSSAEIFPALSPHVLT